METNKLISERQALILMTCALFATKFQRLPALISGSFGRDGWIALLVLLLIDSLLLLLVLKAFQILGKKSIYEVLEQNTGKFVAKLVAVLFVIYFFFKMLVGFKGTHEFFANALFDKLSWQFFSVLFLLLLLFMITKGINTIGRTSEFFIFMIFIGIVVTMALGFSVADFSSLLPILDIDLSSSVSEAVKYNFWFADYMVLFFFFGKIEIKRRFKLKFYLTYVITGLVVVAFFIIFYCINENLAEFQSHGLLALTRDTLLGLGIGRPDWFFILLASLSTTVSVALFGFFACFSLSYIFNIKLNYILVIIFLVILYVVDIFVLSNIELAINFGTNIYYYYSLALNIIFPLLFYIIAMVDKHKNKQTLPNSLSTQKSRTKSPKPKLKKAVQNG